MGLFSSFEITEMARGPKKHLKRLNAPKHWMLDKLGGIWAPRPSTGPHKLRECLPLCLILRNRLRYALTRAECIMIVMRRLVQIDHVVRTDINYPCGFMDVISIEKTNEFFRLLYDTRGRFYLNRLKKNNNVMKEANFKLCKVKKVGVAKKLQLEVILLNTAPRHLSLILLLPTAVQFDILIQISKLVIQFSLISKLEKLKGMFILSWEILPTLLRVKMLGELGSLFVLKSILVSSILSTLLRKKLKAVNHILSQLELRMSLLSARAIKLGSAFLNPKVLG